MNPLSIGSIVAETLAWARSRLDIVVGLIVAVNALPTIAISYFVEPPSADAVDWQYLRLILLVGSITGFITSAMVFTRMTLDYSGAKLAHISAWTLMGRTIGTLFLVSLAVNIATLLGFFALIVPGIFISVVCSVATPVVVAERESIRGAIERSITLTKGFRLQILGLGIFALVVVLGISSVWELIASFFINGTSADTPMWYFIIGETLSSTLGVLIIIGQMVLYRRLVSLHAGLGTNNIDVFD